MSNNLINSNRPDIYSRDSCYLFRVVADKKVTEYSTFLVMTVAMLLRYIHAIITGQTSAYGLFKLRGTKLQFKAALSLYRIFLVTGAENLDHQADWAIHDLFETLVCSTGVNDRAVNYPTDQVLFLWALLSDRTYRIPSHLQPLISAAKYCFRCVALQIARVQHRNIDHPFFEDMASALPTTDIDDNHSSVGNSSPCQGEATEDMAAEDINHIETLRWLEERLQGKREGIDEDIEGMQ